MENEIKILQKPISDKHKSAMFILFVVNIDYQHINRVRLYTIPMQIFAN